MRESENERMFGKLRKLRRFRELEGLEGLERSKPGNNKSKTNC